jgi:hypothetical protein
LAGVREDHGVPELQRLLEQRVLRQRGLPQSGRASPGSPWSACRTLRSSSPLSSSCSRDTKCISLCRPSRLLSLGQQAVPV